MNWIAQQKTALDTRPLYKFNIPLFLALFIVKEGFLNLTRNNSDKPLYKQESLLNGILSKLNGKAPNKEVHLYQTR
jgi:hypothetical protein